MASCAALVHVWWSLVHLFADARLARGRCQCGFAVDCSECGVAVVPHLLLLVLPMLLVLLVLLRAGERQVGGRVGRCGAVRAHCVAVRGACTGVTCVCAADSEVMRS